MDESVEVLRDVLSQLQDLNGTLNQINDGLFQLNLHVGADVTPWTGAYRGSTSAPAPGVNVGGVQPQGIVKWYDQVKGFGFIAPTGGGPDVFVHVSVIPAPGYLREGQPVLFEVMDGEHGPMAIDVQFA